MSTRTVSLRIDDRAVCERCVIADRPFGRMRGLLGRSDLPRGEGILLRPARSVHTFFMRFAIDVVFLDEDDVVVEIAPNLRAWRAAGAKKAHSVVELRAGEAEARGITVGAKLSLADAVPWQPPAALRQAAQTMAEYAVVLTVITSGTILALTLLSERVVGAVDRVIALLP